MSTLLIERQGAVETWTMNDPATRNALSDAVVDGLLQACARAAQDATLRMVVLTGAGGAFCAGGSLGGFASLIGQPLQAGETDPLLAMNRGFGDLLHALSALPQLLVCRVDGAAMGGGFVALHHVPEDEAVSYWPGINPGPAGFEWMSTNALVFAEVTSAGMSGDEFQRRTSNMASIVNDMLSVECAFDWFRHDEDAGEEGFFLDFSLLDEVGL